MTGRESRLEGHGGKRAAMVGDGVNDAPAALATADTGIAVGAVLMSASTVIVAINAQLLKGAEL